MPCLPPVTEQWIPVCPSWFRSQASWLLPSPSWPCQAPLLCSRCTVFLSAAALSIHRPVALSVGWDPCRQAGPLSLPVSPGDVCGTIFGGVDLLIEIFQNTFFLVSYILILFFPLCGPFVLFTLLTVFDILSTYFETQNWPEALKKGVSSRKGYVLQNSVEWWRA